MILIFKKKKQKISTFYNSTLLIDSSSWFKMLQSKSLSHVNKSIFLRTEPSESPSQFPQNATIKIHRHFVLNNKWSPYDFVFSPFSISNYYPAHFILRITLSCNIVSETKFSLDHNFINVYQPRLLLAYYILHIISISIHYTHPAQCSTSILLSCKREPEKRTSNLLYYMVVWYLCMFFSVDSVVRNSLGIISILAHWYTNRHCTNNFPQAYSTHIYWYIHMHVR